MSYSALQDHFRRIGQFNELAAIVEWDQAVNMPASAGPARARSMAGLSRLTHELLLDERLRDWLSEAEGDASLETWQRANVREMKRQQRRACAVPSDLVEATAKSSKLSEQAWRRYRKENDFKSYLPYLENIIQARREASVALGEALNLAPYDALLDGYEPGVRTANLDAAFAPLKEFLPSFTEQVVGHQAKAPPIPFEGPFPVEQQKELGLSLMKACGLDMQRVRLDVSHHPFCGGVPSDVRITTRYAETDFSSALMGVLHEAGHAKYEHGLPEEWQHQPVGEARGMIAHESQSLLQEMQVCRGEAFLRYLAPRLREAFPEAYARQPEAYSVENLARCYTRVERGFIRIDADEVTYPAHVLLRYDLERQLMSGELQARDLPEAWNAKMQSLLGLTTLGNDQDGCLQDVHWPIGAFGYFPLYTVGAMVAAQFFAALNRQVPELSAQLEKGDFEQLNLWLKKAIWSRASSVDLNEMLLDATGEGLNPQCLIEHLRGRYLPQG